MRSIGKKNIRKLKKIINEEIALQKKEFFFQGINYQSLNKAIKDKIPIEWYDIWESAWSEIERLISDFTNNYAHYNNIDGKR